MSLVFFMIQPPPVPELRRELGRWDLTAIGINQVIGGAVFAMPASLAALAGGWSPYLIVGVGLASLMIGVTFAEVGSRFDATGGPYLYTKAAFGRFPAFEIGWMQWFTRVASWASVINVLVASLGYYWPSVTAGPARTAVLAAIIAGLAAINVIGIRQSAWVVNGLTIGKLLPLLLFIVVGVTAIDPLRLGAGPLPGAANLSASALLIVYAIGGYEVIPVPAGELQDPRRAVPFALVMTIVTATVVFSLAHVVAAATLPNLPSSKTPLADASALLMGAAGAAVMTLGAVVSTLGNNMGQALSGSRMLFALAEQGDLPRVFGFVSTRFGTPIVAILVTAAVSFVLATTGSFVSMAQVSAVSRLMLCVATCASALRLRSPRFEGRVAEPAFRVPLGPLIPSLAIAVACTILFGATGAQLRAGAYTLAAGAVLFAVASISGRKT
jgi:amino acid transporter